MSAVNPFADRYSRQVRVPGIGKAGQDRIAAARVTLCGVGALGTVLANTLVRAGVGHIRVVDRDFVEPSNLQRQVLFDEADVLEQPAQSRGRRGQDAGDQLGASSSSRSSRTSTGPTLKICAGTRTLYPGRHRQF